MSLKKELNYIVRIVDLKWRSQQNVDLHVKRVAVVTPVNSNAVGSL